MVVATALVVVLPVVVVWVLVAEGVISSPWLALGLAIVLSLGASIAGAAYWKRRRRPDDLLFSEILLWGWLRRFQTERRFASAAGVLGLTGAEAGHAPDAQTVEQKAQTLKQMATALDAQDPYTQGHSRRVALHSAMIARKMGMSRAEVTKIQMAGAVHDVGKLRIPPEVLNKPSALTPAEFEIIKRHVDEGAEIVSVLHDPELAAMVTHHHERFDGTGYPARLAGEDIPVGARVIAVADTFDALTSERPYRAAVPHKQALAVITEASGSQLDPVAVRAFLKSYSSKRVLLFWMLLAVSPQRALATLGGRKAPRPTTGTATSIATPAALAAIVVAAVGTTGNLGHAAEPARFAERQGPTPTLPAGTVSGTGQNSGSTKSTLTGADGARAKHTTHRTTITGGGNPSAGLASHAQDAAHNGNSSSPPASAGSGSGSGGGSSSGGGGSAGGGAGSGSGGGSGGHHGGSSHGGSQGGSKGGKRGSTGTHHPGGGSSGPAAPPSTSGSSSSGSNGGNTGTGGSGGGNGGGTGQGGGTGGAGGGNGGGSGNQGGNEPQSKQACMGGGWLQFGFSNQGLCIAFVEHNLHGRRGRHT